MSSRVIGLIDLDCFYAQCESIRLGLSPSTPLVVLQWSMTLAVSYAARQLGIKRGNSYHDIKHHKSVVFIHVETYSVSEDIVETEPDALDSLADSRVTKYKAQYSLTAAEKQATLATENHYRPDNSTHKASIERYRYVSGLIFGAIRDHLDATIGKSSYILEKASVDELFLDLTKYCNGKSCNGEDCNDEDCNDQTTQPALALSKLASSKLASSTFVIAAPGHPPPLNLSLGSNIITGVRDHVFATLGYTMSAGVYHNKSLAKLLASEKKPNGQALLAPSALDEFLERTPLMDVRGHGGKYGKKIASVVLTHEGVVGGEATAVMLSAVARVPRHVFEKNGLEGERILQLAMWGSETEAVEMTEVGAPTKSINSYKSFYEDEGSFAAITSWKERLAEEIVKRVTDDTARNSRVPKTLTVYFASVRGDTGTKSKQTQLPTKISKEIVCAWVEKNLPSGSSVFPLVKMGLSVSNFNQWATDGIASHFAPTTTMTTTTTTSLTTTTAAKITKATSPPLPPPPLPPPPPLFKPPPPPAAETDEQMAQRLYTELNDGEAARLAKEESQSAAWIRDHLKQEERHSMVREAGKKRALATRQKTSAGKKSPVKKSKSGCIASFFNKPT